MWKERDKRNGTTILVVLIGLGLALAVLEYGGATGSASGVGRQGVATLGRFEVAAPVAGESAAKTKRLTRAQKLRKALAACKKQKSKSKRKACEKRAEKQYGRSPTKEPGNEIPTEKPKTTETPEQEQAHARTVSTTPTVSNVASGKSIFDANCQNCHGPEGNGTASGPNLHMEPRAQSITGVIEQLIAPATTMPSFDTVLTFTQKEEAADYVAVEITKVVAAVHP